MADDVPGLSRSVEDYLKVIYSLCTRGGTASTSDIAEALEVQPASVTGMVKRLAETGFLEHAPYRGVELTPAGTREALRILRRHRILETYLTERLGFSWEEVHREAERLEHAASDALIDRMAAALEEPSHDPHGAPIPTRGGEIEVTDSLTLAEVAPGGEVQIRAVRDDDSDRLRTIETAGLLPGNRVTVVRRSPSGSVVQVRVGAGEGRELDVEISVARRVYVVPSLPPSPSPGSPSPSLSDSE
jgi:DtxR family Mn-dependent transcriptional regulator